MPSNDRYKWIALSNTTLGMLMATINSSITLIALPDIFRGIGLNPLAPGNVSYLLWMLMGFLVVTAVLVVTFGRIGDMYGRVRMYVLGFAVFSVGSILLSVDWMHGGKGALYLIVMRVVQGLGAAMLMANSAAILTDAFPANQRGLALGINNVAAIAGSFMGLVIGGLLGPVDWRLVFLVSVPIGVLGTVWAYLKLEERGVRKPARLDWWGNATFAAGLIAVLVGITYGIQPYGGHTMGWTSPMVLGLLIGGVALLVAFCVIETRVADPMFHLPLFRLRSFTMGNLASLLSSLGRGGLMFMLIIWLQGIWLPLHGYSFSATPLWAGIYMVPLTVGFLVSGPSPGYLSDHFGARSFATGGMVLSAVAFILLETLPVNFGYIWFALLLFALGRRDGAVRFSQPGPDHEQPAAWPAGRRRRHERHVPELGHGAVDRRLLQLHGARARRQPAQPPLPRARSGGRARAPGDHDLPPAAGGHALRRLPRLQPDGCAARRFHPSPVGGQGPDVDRAAATSPASSPRPSKPGCARRSTSPPWPVSWRRRPPG